MSKLYIMQGLPASGKSTRAKQIVESSGNTVRINRDLIRTMLHFDKWSGINEGRTKETARLIAGYFLGKELNVIIDDTNLDAGTIQSWKDLAKNFEANVEVVKMDTSIEECLARDEIREKKVGRDVIIGMALRNGLYPKPEKGFVLCDLDGTLCDISHRLHFAKQQPKDWKSFFAGISGDKPRLDVIDMLLEYEGKGHQIIFISARPDTYREATEKWLEGAFKGYCMHVTLIMRRGGDCREDSLIKQEIYENYFKDKYPIEVVIDDRPRVIRMWREQGLNVVDVGDGVEF